MPDVRQVTVRRYADPDRDRAGVKKEARMGAERGAAALLRGVGLLPDGPVVWGRPLTTRAPGVYLVELAEPQPTATLELSRIGAWIAGLPDLRLDGVRPTSKALAARLAAFWLPSETVVYIGATSRNLGGRVLAMAHHELGSRQPHPDGQWLHALRGIERARVWWAETDATEEYLDALFDAFAAEVEPRAALSGGIVDGRPAGALALPWANTRRPTGERQAHGITGAVAAAEPTTARPTRVVDVPPAAADGVPTVEHGTGTTRRGPRPASTGASARASRPAAATRGRGAGPTRQAAPANPPAESTGRRRQPGGGRAGAVEPVPMTREAHARLEAELHELTRVRRPEVVARIKAARELGDLRENAEYHAAREEQSFLEGRVRLLEERRRHAVIIEDHQTGRIALGSVVVVEHEGESMTYTLVGTTDAAPRAGRISSASPVGAALLGAAAGQTIEVRTPRGVASYRVVEVS
jgi:transcription elongation factor GreA